MLSHCLDIHPINKMLNVSLNNSLVQSGAFVGRQAWLVEAVLSFPTRVSGCGLKPKGYILGRVRNKPPGQPGDEAELTVGQNRPAVKWVYVTSDAIRHKMLMDFTTKYKFR